MSAKDQKRAINTMNKTKFKEFTLALRNILVNNIDTPDKVELLHNDIISMLCDIVKFDPQLSNYDKSKVDALRQATGLSTYDIFQKKFYHAHKEEMDVKIVAKTRERRARLKQTMLGAIVPLHSESGINED